MIEYSEHFASHLRLAILRLLADQPGYTVNSSVIAEVSPSLGFDVTRDRIRTELSWLSENGLLATRQPTPGLLVATATERGLDVAAGRAVVPGVQRPHPGPRP